MSIPQFFEYLAKWFKMTLVKPLLISLKLFFTLVILSVIIFLIDTLGFLKLPKSVLQNITVPVQYGLYFSGQKVYKQFDFLISLRKSAQEKKALQQQMGELISENANLRRKLAEAETIVDQQNSLSPKTFNLLAARPIGKDRYLLIDRGSGDGIAEGQVVVFKDNFVGQIRQVSPHSSKLLLQQDPDSKIAAFSQGSEGKARGILSGQFGSQLLLDKILHQESINEGDLVYSEGTEGRLPKGLVLGRVVQVLKRENEIFKQAYIKPVFQISDLELVFVILNP